MRQPARPVGLPRTALTWLLAALAALALPPSWALAQTPQVDAPAAQNQTPTIPQAFGLEVRSSDEGIRDFLTQHLDLQRYRSLSDLDEMELTRLLREAGAGIEGAILGRALYDGRIEPKVALAAAV